MVSQTLASNPSRFFIRPDWRDFSPRWRTARSTSSSTGGSRLVWHERSSAANEAERLVPRRSSALRPGRDVIAARHKC